MDWEKGRRRAAVRIQAPVQIGHGVPLSQLITEVRQNAAAGKPHGLMEADAAVVGDGDDGADVFDALGLQQGEQGVGEELPGTALPQIFPGLVLLCLP